jgi:hypothetical protein
VLLVLVLLDSENATSQSGSVQTATMKDGRVVILKTDGTWEYAKETRKEGISNQTAEKATLLEVQTDQVAYVERPVVITGTLEMFSYYFGGYRNSQDTHYAFLLRDPSRGASSADVYMRRGEVAANLRKLLLQNNGRIEGSFTIAILKERIQQPQDLFNKLGVVVAELIDYSLSNSPANVGVNNMLLPNATTATPPQETNSTVKNEPAPEQRIKSEDIVLLEFMKEAAGEGTGRWIPIWGSQKGLTQYYGENIKRKNNDLFAWWMVEYADPVMSKGVKQIIDYRQVNCEFNRQRALVTSAVYADGRPPLNTVSLVRDWRHPSEGTYEEGFQNAVCKAGKKIQEDKRLNSQNALNNPGSFLLSNAVPSSPKCIASVLGFKLSQSLSSLMTFIDKYR